MSQVVQFSAGSGFTSATAQLFSLVADTSIASTTATEAAEGLSTYTAVFSGVAAGTYRIIAFDSTGYPFANYEVDLGSADGVYQAYDMSPVQIAASILSGGGAYKLAVNSDGSTNISAGSITAARTEIDTNSAKLASLLSNLSAVLAVTNKFRFTVPNQVDSTAVSGNDSSQGDLTAVDQNFGSDDALQYTDPNGNGIAGAKILVFTQAAYQAATELPPPDNLAVGNSTTVAGGTWASPIWLPPGYYVVQFSLLPTYDASVSHIIVGSPDGSEPTPPPTGDWNV